MQKLIVLMATGGTLTSLAESGAGTLAGNAQMDVWREIVRRDGVAISGALHRGLFVPFLRRAFPGRPALARLVLGRETEPTAGEAADLAGKLRAAGYRVDQSQLEEATGFKLEREEPQPQPGFGGFGGFANKAAPQDPDSGVAKPLQNARRGSDGEVPPPDAETRLNAILDDFSARLAEEMQDEMFSAAAKALDGGKDEGETVQNSTQNWHRCPKCGKFSGFDGHCGKCNFILTGNDAKKRSSALLDAAARDAYAKRVVGLAYREGLGRIDLPVGRLGEFVDGERKHGQGLSKIRAKHDVDLEHLPDTLTFGEILRTRHYDKPENPENPNRRAIVHNGFVCFLTKHGDAWEISTHYKPKDNTVANLKTIAEAL